MSQRPVTQWRHKRAVPANSRCARCGVLLSGTPKWSPHGHPGYHSVWCAKCGPTTTRGLLALDLGPNWMGRRGRWKDPKQGV